MTDMQGSIEGADSVIYTIGTAGTERVKAEPVFNDIWLGYI